MPAPTAAELLGAWERSAPLGPVEREDTLLRLAEPGLEPAELAVGERDARLLELRELLFGTELDGIAECPRCGEPVEFALETGDLLAGRPEHGVVDLVVSGRTLRARLPTGADLAEAAVGRRSRRGPCASARALPGRGRRRACGRGRRRARRAARGG